MNVVKSAAVAWLALAVTACGATRQVAATSVVPTLTEVATLSAAPPAPAATSSVPPAASSATASASASLRDSSTSSLAAETSPSPTATPSTTPAASDQPAPDALFTPGTELQAPELPSGPSAEPAASVTASQRQPQVTLQDIYNNGYRSGQSVAFGLEHSSAVNAPSYYSTCRLRAGFGQMTTSLTAFYTGCLDGARATLGI